MSPCSAADTLERCTHLLACGKLQRIAHAAARVLIHDRAEFVERHCSVMVGAEERAGLRPDREQLHRRIPAPEAEHAWDFETAPGFLHRFFGRGGELRFDLRLVLLDAADHTDQPEHRQQRRREQQAVDDQPIEIAGAEQGRRAKDAGRNAGARNRRAGHRRSLAVDRFKARQQRQAAIWEQAESATVCGRGKHGVLRSQSGDPAAVGAACEDAHAFVLSQLRPCSVGGFALCYGVKRYAAPDGLERSP